MAKTIRLSNEDSIAGIINSDDIIALQKHQAGKKVLKNKKGQKVTVDDDGVEIKYCNGYGCNNVAIYKAEGELKVPIAVSKKSGKLVKVEDLRCESCKDEIKHKKDEDVMTYRINPIHMSNIRKAISAS